MSSTAGRTSQMLLIAASTMLFAAFTSAMVVRRGMATDWSAPDVPIWIWLTAPIVGIASVLVERRHYAPAAGFGGILVAAQLIWIREQHWTAIGEAFTRLLLGAHAAHALAGAMALVVFREKAGLFWHFAALLWIYLLILLGVWA